MMRRHFAPETDSFTRKRLARLKKNRFTRAKSHHRLVWQTLFVDLAKIRSLSLSRKINTRQHHFTTSGTSLKKSVAISSSVRWSAPRFVCHALSKIAQMTKSKTPVRVRYNFPLSFFLIFYFNETETSALRLFVDQYVCRD